MKNFNYNVRTLLGRYTKWQHEWSVWMLYIYWCSIMTVQNMWAWERALAIMGGAYPSPG